MKKTFYVLVQCTWGVIQTLVGLFVFLIYHKNEHFNYYGSIVTKWQHSSSVSLGLFVFINQYPQFMHQGRRLSKENSFDRLLVHEYGHTIQSLYLGPLYLIIIGIPSALWGAFGYRYRMSNQCPYGHFYTEKWANVCGEKVTGSDSIQDIVF